MLHDKCTLHVSSYSFGCRFHPHCAVFSLTCAVQVRIGRKRRCRLLAVVSVSRLVGHDGVGRIVRHQVVGRGGMLGRLRVVGRGLAVGHGLVQRGQLRLRPVVRRRRVVRRGNGARGHADRRVVGHRLVGGSRVPRRLGVVVGGPAVGRGALGRRRLRHGGVLGRRGVMGLGRVRRVAVWHIACSSVGRFGVLCRLDVVVRSLLAGRGGIRRSRFCPGRVVGCSCVVGRRGGARSRRWVRRYSVGRGGMLGCFLVVVCRVLVGPGRTGRCRPGHFGMVRGSSVVSSGVVKYGGVCGAARSLAAGRGVAVHRWPRVLLMSHTKMCQELWQGDVTTAVSLDVPEDELQHLAGILMP